MEAASRAEVPGAGAPIARRLTVSRRRYGETLVKYVLLACAAVSVLTTVGIVVALAEPTIEFFQDISLGEFFTGHGVVAPVRAFELRRAAARRRDAQHDVLGVRGRIALRAGRRDLPVASTRGRARDNG